MKNMPEKKNFNPHNGNNVNQDMGGSTFVDDYNTWKKNCQGVSGESMQVKHIENLYVMLRNHMKNNIRTGSRNEGRDDEGAIQFITTIEGFIDSGMFTMQHARLIEAMASTLEKMKDTGKDAGGKTPAYDPAFILFTEKPRSRTGELLEERTVQGHYATEWYAERNEGVTAVPPSWLAGENPPHQALFSETSNQFAKPKGLLYIMQDATGALKEAELEVEVETIPTGIDAVDIDEIKSVEKFFNAAIKNQAFWSEGGKLLVNKLRAELQSTKFPVTKGEQSPVREITNLGKVDEKDAIAGTVTSFTLTSTATPIINLIDRALQRAGTNQAPNGFRAWQNATKRGFDYRKTARERFGEDTGSYSPDARTIGKMWQQLLWKD